MDRQQSLRSIFYCAIALMGITWAQQPKVAHAADQGPALYGINFLELFDVWREDRELANTVIDEMRDAKIGFVRLWVKWKDCEPLEGQYIWHDNNDELGDLFDTLTAAGIMPLPQIGYQFWEDGKSYAISGIDTEGWDRHEDPLRQYAPVSFANFRRFMVDFMLAYDGISWIQVTSYNAGDGNDARPYGLWTADEVTDIYRFAYLARNDVYDLTGRYVFLRHASDTRTHRINVNGHNVEDRYASALNRYGEDYGVYTDQQVIRPESAHYRRSHNMVHGRYDETAEWVREWDKFYENHLGPESYAVYVPIEDPLDVGRYYLDLLAQGVHMVGVENTYDDLGTVRYEEGFVDYGDELEAARLLGESFGQVNGVTKIDTKDNLRLNLFEIDGTGRAEYGLWVDTNVAHRSDAGGILPGENTLAFNKIWLHTQLIEGYGQRKPNPRAWKSEIGQDVEQSFLVTWGTEPILEGFFLPADAGTVSHDIDAVTLRNHFSQLFSEGEPDIESLGHAAWHFSIEFTRDEIILEPTDFEYEDLDGVKWITLQPAYDMWGLAILENGSNEVEGFLPERWLVSDDIHAGMEIKFFEDENGPSESYTIASVQNCTHLTLTTPYQGTSGHKHYRIEDIRTDHLSLNRFTEDIVSIKPMLERQRFHFLDNQDNRVVADNATAMRITLHDTYSDMRVDANNPFGLPAGEHPFALPVGEERHMALEEIEVHATAQTSVDLTRYLDIDGYVEVTNGVTGAVRTMPANALLIDDAPQYIAFISDVPEVLLTAETVGGHDHVVQGESRDIHITVENTTSETVTIQIASLIHEYNAGTLQRITPELIEDVVRNPSTISIKPGQRLADTVTMHCPLDRAPGQNDIQFLIGYGFDEATLAFDELISQVDVPMEIVER